MNWYIAKLVFQILNTNKKKQFDEQLRLIQAGSYSEAMEKATSIGLGEQDSFPDSANNQVHWRFIAVPELQKLEHLQHGTELYSRIEEREEEHYIQSLKMRADTMLSSNTYRLISL